MRITQAMLADSTLRNIQRTLVPMERAQRELSSGKRISRPSDDPLGAGLALSQRAALTASGGYLRTIDSALTWIGASDAALGSAVDVLQRAHELALQGANDALGSDQLQAIADEVQALLEQLVALGNSQVRGLRLFAGLQVNTDPMTLNPGPPASVTYAGDPMPMVRQIDDQQSVVINVPGTVFSTSYAALISLRDHLRASDTTAIRSMDLASLNGGLVSLLDARAQLGATGSQLEAARDRLELGRVSSQERLSKLEDTDIADAASRLALYDTVYRAGLATAARFDHRTLFDYLR